MLKESSLYEINTFNLSEEEDTEWEDDDVEEEDDIEEEDDWDE